MAEDLVEYLKQRMQLGVETSHEVTNALQKIEKEESINFSEVIQHLKIAEDNFNDALKKMGDYELAAINRLEKKYQEKQDILLNTSENLISKLWKHLIS
jgi:hypothetical protein